MRNHKVSVIISAHNEEQYIEKCIVSLFSQALLPSEIIVIDDGSSDKTWNILYKLRNAVAKKNIIYKIYKKNHIGQSKARNYGTKRSSGDILVFPDADMYFDKNYIDLLIKPIIDKKSIASFTKDEHVSNTENIWSQCWSINSYLPFHKRMPDNTSDKTNNIRAIKRKFFFKAGGFSDVGFNNDITILDKLNLPKGSFAAHGAVCFHNNPASLSKVFFSARYRGRGGAEPGLENFLRYSILNSLRRGIIDGLRYKKPQFLIFKLVFDFGFFSGLLEKKYMKKPPIWE
ncbi:MAG: glycosyltransferase family 2 protein [Candidatus Levybacteria bacterium]|nr:glycosyltransferase family 2 protein [Candidatus Levybacteria bacterium]